MMDSSTVNELKRLFWNRFNEACQAEALPESGSARKYFRLKGKNNSAIGAFNSDIRENEAFFYLTDHMNNHGVNVPELYLIDGTRQFYLQQDLGDTMLYNYITAKKEDGEAILNIYRNVINYMPQLQMVAARGLDFSRCFPRAAFDRQSMMWDLQYFKSYFLKLTGVKFDEQALEDDFNLFIDFLLQADSHFFLFRDFQSRNIMLHDGKVFFIDYQGGRKGALQYDLASLLFEAKTSLSPTLRRDLLEHYLLVFANEPGFNRASFLQYFDGFVLIRMMQAMGAYGYRGYFERKLFFLQSIPPAINNLKWFLEHGRMDIKLPQLYACFNQIAETNLVREMIPAAGKLTVSINSFSYRYGIPQDNSGNGGGFIFDCRFMPNPGREEKYKSHSGKDICVIEYLQNKPEVQDFLHHALAMVEAAITNYTSRNFAHLMVSFGCTGGQHRSVYCAEQLAKALSGRFDVLVELKHRQLI